MQLPIINKSILIIYILFLCLYLHHATKVSAGVVPDFVGKVVNSVTGAPITGVWVAMRTSGNQTWQGTAYSCLVPASVRYQQTDTNGFYRFDGVMPYTSVPESMCNDKRLGKWIDTNLDGVNDAQQLPTNPSTCTTPDNKTTCGYDFGCLSSPMHISVVKPSGWNGSFPNTNTFSFNNLDNNVTFSLPDLIYIPPTYTISGNIFIDTNRNNIKDNGEANYTGAITIQGNQGSETVNVTNGAYTLNNVLAGNDIITYTNPPSAQGYTMTTPLNGPPPSYSVNVGNTCNSNGAPGATCNNGNIINLNFGITDYDPWAQFTCGSVRLDTGITNKIPSASKTSQYTIQTSASCTNPGVFISGDSTPTFSNGSVSSTNFLSGGGSYPEVYKTTGTHLSTSCSLLQAKAKTNKLPINDLSSVCNISSCTLPASLPHGIWQANGDLNLNSFNVPANNNYVFFVNGKTQLNGTIIAPQGNNNSFMLCSKDNIAVGSNVGSAANVATSSLDGIFTTDKSFILNSNNNCNDLRLNISGAIVTNAGRTGGTLQNNRDFCLNNSFYPTFTVTQRADLLLNLPDLLRQEQSTTSEVAP